MYNPPVGGEKKICRCKRIRPIYLRKRGSFDFGNQRSRAAFLWPEFRKITEHCPCLAILKWESIKSKIPSKRARMQPVKLSSLCAHHKHHRPALITPRASRCITLLWKHGPGEWSLKLSERDPPALSDQSERNLRMDGAMKGGVWDDEWNHLMRIHLVTVMIQAFFNHEIPFMSLFLMWDQRD